MVKTGKKKLKSGNKPRTRRGGGQLSDIKQLDQINMIPVDDVPTKLSNSEPIVMRWGEKSKSGWRRTATIGWDSQYYTIDAVQKKIDFSIAEESNAFKTASSDFQEKLRKVDGLVVKDLTSDKKFPDHCGDAKLGKHFCRGPSNINNQNRFFVIWMNIKQDENTSIRFEAVEGSWKLDGTSSSSGKTLSPTISGNGISGNGTELTSLGEYSSNGGSRSKKRRHKKKHRRKSRKR